MCTKYVNSKGELLITCSNLLSSLVLKKDQYVKDCINYCPNCGDELLDIKEVYKDIS